MEKPRVTNGLLLLSIGVIHNLLGLAVGLGLPGVTPASLGGRRLLAEIASEGMFGSVEPDLWRMLLFWFLFFGFAIMILGFSLHRTERARHPLPRALAWQLGGLALLGGVLIPASGFWLVLPVAWRMGRAAGAPAARVATVAAARE
jgi:Family of unknown function (DUF6463)